MSEDPYYEAVLHATRDVFVHGGGLTGRVEQDKRMADRLRERFVVIDRADLPEVTTQTDGRGTWYRAAAGKPQGPARITIGTALHTAGAEDVVEHAERRVKEFAALVVHLREHPPEDEAQVNAIADAVDTVESESGKYGEPTADFARRLYERGVRVEKP